MMARFNLSALITALLFIHSAVALPFGSGWFKKHGNGTAPAWPTSFPTGTGSHSVRPTGWFHEKRGEHHHVSGGFPHPTGVKPSGGFPAHPTGWSHEKRERHHHVSGGFPHPTGGFPHPTGGFALPSAGAEKHHQARDAEEVKEKKSFGTGFPHPSGGFPHPSGGFPHPTGGFPHPTGGFPQPTGGFALPSAGAEKHHHARAAEEVKEKKAFGTGFPHPSDGFPHPTGGFPHPTGGFPHPTGGFPFPSGGFPHHSGGFPHPTGTGFPALPTGF